MSEIKLTVQDQYLSAFLTLLNSIDYVKIEQVNQPNKKERPNESASDVLMKTLPIDDPLRQVIKPIRTKVSLDTIIKEQNYTRTNWQKLTKIAQEMAIEEPIEELLAQLKM